MNITPLIVDSAVEIIELLRVSPLRKAQFVEKIDVSGPTILRALTWLRSEGAPIIHDRKIECWTLTDHDWSIPWNRLPCWALRADLREIVGPGVDPLTVLRRAVEAGLHLQDQASPPGNTGSEPAVALSCVSGDG